MTNQNCSWHVCHDCLEPLAKRIASQNADSTSPGRIDLDSLLRIFQFPRALAVLQAAVGVPLATEVQARVSAVQEAARMLDEVAFKCYLEEYPLPDDCTSEQREAVRDSAGWKYAYEYWTNQDEGYTSSQATKTIAQNYRKLQQQAVELAKYLLVVSDTVGPKVDAFTRNTTATTLQQCLHRLQHLRTWFWQVQNSQELVDAMQEGGHILAQLVHSKCLSADDLLPGEGSTKVLADYVSKALADRRTGNPMETEGLARFTQRALWELFAHWGTDQQRIILNPVAAPALGIRITATDYQVGFRRQGQQFSLLVMGLLEKLQRVTAATSMPYKPKAPARGLSLTELNRVMTPILADAGEGIIPFPTAEQMVGLLKEMGYKTSVSQVKKEGSLWRKFNRANGGGRNRKPKEYNSVTIAYMADQETRSIPRSGRRAKPILSDE
jgi:hypothetical protein